MSDSDQFQNFDEDDFFKDENDLIDFGMTTGIERQRSSASCTVEIEKFLSLILESGLIELDELNDACKDYFAESSVMGVEPSFNAFCEFLISTRRLTEWQCNLLKKGQSQGFFIDQYELLNDLGPDDSSTNYLAQEKNTNRRVKLRITPIIPFPFPVEKPHYEVEEL
jgi:hypothetical protein